MSNVEELFFFSADLLESYKAVLKLYARLLIGSFTMCHVCTQNNSVNGTAAGIKAMLSLRFVCKVLGYVFTL